MGSTLIDIRQASIQDINLMTDLLRQLFSIEKDFKFNEKKTQKGLLLILEGCGKHKTIMVASINKKLVGMCTIQTRISTATGNISGILEDLVVDKEYRGKGVGKALLSKIYPWAKQRGILNLQLLADRENQPALDFYNKRNWKLTRLICLTQNL